MRCFQGIDANSTYSKLALNDVADAMTASGIVPQSDGLFEMKTEREGK